MRDFWPVCWIVSIGLVLAACSKPAPDAAPATPAASVAGTHETVADDEEAKDGDPCRLLEHKEVEAVLGQPLGTPPLADQIVEVNVAGSKAFIQDAATLADAALKRIGKPLAINGSGSTAAHPTHHLNWFGDLTIRWEGGYRELRESADLSASVAGGFGLQESGQLSDELAKALSKI